jgi:hypothetical protein
VAIPGPHEADVAEVPRSSQVPAAYEATPFSMRLGRRIPLSQTSGFGQMLRVVTNSAGAD